MELVNIVKQIPFPVLAVLLVILLIVTIVMGYQYAKMKGLEGIRKNVYELIL